MAARWINVILGAWLVILALVVPGSRGGFFGDHLVVGTAIFVLAFLAMADPRFRLGNVVLGGWVALSPFVFGYLDRGIAVNDIVVGILVVNFALARPARPRQRREPLRTAA